MDEKNDELYQIGLNIKLVREDRKMSAAELARLMNVDRPRIYAIESGKNCEIKCYKDAADALNISMELLSCYHLMDKIQRQKNHGYVILNLGHEMAFHDIKNNNQDHE
jgi:transcriptional regulator with XRE-family HTH domain